MKYDIYFHDDFDGRASAAVMLGFLRSRGDTIENFVPVNFDIQEQWTDDQFFEHNGLVRGGHNPAIVVDFLYHPGAAFWFDHHETTFKKDAWKKEFRRNKNRTWMPEMPSCCHTVLVSLEKNFGWKPERRFGELAKWLDVVDGALYSSAKQVFIMKEPALQIDGFIEKTSLGKTSAENARLAEWLVKELALRPMKEIAAMPRVAAAVAKYRDDIEKSMQFYGKNLEITGKVAFIDLTETKRKRLIFAPFYLHPKLSYAMRFTMREGWFHLSVGQNPWRPQKKIHIGNMLRRYDGGGHAGVGGVEFRDREHALVAIREIIETLNKKG